MSFLEPRAKELNAPQLEAVRSTEGPVLVLAGAGSGKTRVLTYRIAHIVKDLGVPLSNVLAMTFSNKAAREMQSRVQKLLLSHQPLPWISTFHAVGAKILRRFGSKLGIKPEFAIYDEDDQRSILKSCQQNLNIDERDYALDAIHKKIGEWKNEGRNSREVQNFRTTGFDEVCVRMYEAYETEMLKAQALDFDDLLLKTYQLFRIDPELKKLFCDQWQYILVDEFQDTNDLQYKLLKEFLNANQNICVVGDDDQSIYGWRGAKIDNILNFDKEFPKAKVVKLEQNYRSTATILKAADQIISKNEMRHSKHLWTAEGVGERIQVAALLDDRAEASFVVNEIQRLIRAKVSPEEIAVLYRINSLSRNFEEECLKQRVPYRIIGGFRFYERREIKDVLSYLKLLMNPADIVSFRRSVNTPARGVGKVSIEKIEALANEAEKPIGDFLITAPSLPGVGRGKEGLQQYREILFRGRTAIETNESFIDLVVELLDKARLIQIYKDEGSAESQERVENIQELLSAVQEFEETWRPQEGAADCLQNKMIDFLERVSLISDADQMDQDPQGNPVEPQAQVTFMSIHAAKGLEFKACFIAGLEEGIFPTLRSLDNYPQLEEERRLCYVAITRAREKLYLSRALRRRTYGNFNSNMESRFIKDLSKDLIAVTMDQTEDVQDSWGGYSYQPRFQKKQPQKAVNDFDFDFDQRVPETEFSKGDRVTHPSFGRGVVQRAEFLGSDECLAIVFEGRGQKKVLAKFVKRL